MLPMRSQLSLADTRVRRGTYMSKRARIPSPLERLVRVLSLQEPGCHAGVNGWFDSWKSLRNHYGSPRNRRAATIRRLASLASGLDVIESKGEL
jgi:hypothetical protein